MKFRCRKQLRRPPSKRLSSFTLPSSNIPANCLERKFTGAAFALNILWSTSTLEVLSDTLSTYPKVADNGNTITNHSCSQCGSLLYRTTSGYPGMMVIKAGCIDGVDAAKEYVPEVEIFTRSRVPWVQPVDAKQDVGDFGSGSV